MSMNMLEINVYTAQIGIHAEPLLIEAIVFDNYEQRLNYLLYEPKDQKRFVLSEFFGIEECLGYDGSKSFDEVLDRDCSIEDIRDILTMTYTDFSCCTIEAHIYNSSLMRSPQLKKTIIINPVTDAIASIF